MDKEISPFAINMFFLKYPVYNMLIYAATKSWFQLATLCGIYVALQYIQMRRSNHGKIFLVQHTDDELQKLCVCVQQFRSGEQPGF